MTLDYEVIIKSGSALAWDATVGNDVKSISITNSDSTNYQNAELELYGPSSVEYTIGANLDIFIDNGNGLINEFSGYINRKETSIDGVKVTKIQGVGRTYNLSRYLISSEVTFTEQKSAYIVSSLTGTYGSGIATDQITVTDGVSIDEIKFKNTTLFKAIKILSEYDGYYYYITSGNKLIYYETDDIPQFTISESDILQMSPIEQTDDKLVNDCLILGDTLYKEVEQASTDGGGFFSPTGCVASTMNLMGGSIAETYDFDTTTYGHFDFRVTGSMTYKFSGAIPGTGQRISKIKVYASGIKEIGTIGESKQGLDLFRPSGGEIIEGDMTNPQHTWDDNTATVALLPVDQTNIFMWSTSQVRDRVWNFMLDTEGLWVRKIEYSTDGETFTTLVDSGDPDGWYIYEYNWYFDPITVQYWKVTMNNGRIAECRWNRKRYKDVWISKIELNSGSATSPISYPWEEVFNGTWHLNDSKWNTKQFDTTYSAARMKITFSDNESNLLRPHLHDVRIMGTQGTPTYYRISGGGSRVAQQFVADYSQLTGIKVYTDRSIGNNAPDSLIGEIYTTGSNGFPDTLVENSNTIAWFTTDITNPPMWSPYYDYDYNSNILPLTVGNKYWLVLKGENVSSNRWWDIGYALDDVFASTATSKDSGVTYEWQTGINLRLYLGWDKDDIEGRYIDDDSLDTYGRYYKQIKDNSFKTNEDAILYATTLVERYKNPFYRGNTKVNGRTDVSLGSKFTLNVNNAQFTEDLKIRSYTQTIDGQGFSTTIQYGEHEYDIAGQVAILQEEMESS